MVIFTGSSRQKSRASRWISRGHVADHMSENVVACYGLPMAIGLGEGSELRSPMALTVIGGLLTSTFLTLLIVPAVYSVLDRRG